MVNQYYFLTASGIIDKKDVYTFKLCNKLCKLKCNKYVLKPTSNKLSLKFYSNLRFCDSVVLMKLLVLFLIRRVKHWASKNKLHFVTKFLRKEGVQAAGLQMHSLPWKKGRGRKASDPGLISCQLDLYGNRVCTVRRRRS